MHALLLSVAVLGTLKLAAFALAIGALGMAFAQHTDEVRKVKEILRSQRTELTISPYYSRVELNATRSGAGPFAYTIAAGTVASAFGYARGQAFTGAQPAPTAVRQATLADTNIQKPNETNSGEAVLVTGVSAQLEPDCPAVGLAAAVWANAFVELSLNGGKQNVLLGKLSMIPGASGLYGAGRDDIATQGIPGPRPLFGFASNGIPAYENQLPVPEGLVWMPAGKEDSNMQIRVTLARDAVSQGLLADDAVAAGVRGYTSPTSSVAGFNVFVPIMFRLHGMVGSPRSHII